MSLRLSVWELTSAEPYRSQIVTAHANMRGRGACHSEASQVTDRVILLLPVVDAEADGA